MNRILSLTESDRLIIDDLNIEYAEPIGKIDTRYGSYFVYQYQEEDDNSKWYFATNGVRTTVSFSTRMELMNHLWKFPS